MKKEPEKIKTGSEKSWVLIVLLTSIAVGCILVDGYFMGQMAYMLELHVDHGIPPEPLMAIAVLGFCSGLIAFLIAVVKLFKAKSGKDARVALLTILLILFVGFGSLGAVVLNMESRTNAGIVESQKREKTSPPKPQLSKYEIGPPDAQEMLELVNQERAKVGVAPLKLDERLNASAQEKADDMQNRDYYDHKSPDGIEGYSLVFKHMPNRCRYASENLAKVSTTDNKFGSSRFTIDNWMHSTKGHREAILDAKYSLVGFGISRQGYDLIVVQHFCEFK